MTEYKIKREFKINDIKDIAETFRKDLEDLSNKTSKFHYLNIKYEIEAYD